MVLDSVSIEDFQDKDLDERKTPHNDMETSASVPKSPPQTKPMDLNAIPAVTLVPKTKMASPSMPQCPAVPVSNHASILETTASSQNATNTHFYPSANSFSSQSTSVGTNCMGDVDGCNEETANARMRDALPRKLINKSAATLPSMSPHGKTSPTSLPDEPVEYSNPHSLALRDRKSFAMPSLSASDTETATSMGLDLTAASKVDKTDIATSLAPKLANELTIARPQSDLHAASVGRGAMGVVLTCHDRLETALTPKNIIEYKSMDSVGSPSLESNDKVCKSVDGLSKQAPMPKNNMASPVSVPQNGSRASALSTPQNCVEYSSCTGQIDSNAAQSGIVNTQIMKNASAKSDSDLILTGSANNNASLISIDRTNSSEFPLMSQTNMAAAASVTHGTEVKVKDRNALESTERPYQLDFPQTNMETSTSVAKRRSELSSKSPSGDKLPSRISSGTFSVSQNKIKGDHSTSKRNIDSPTRPKIISKSPSHEKTDKRLFRYTIGGLPGSPQTKMEYPASVPKATSVLPSKPKTITKSPSVDKMDKRLNRSITEMSSMPQNKMAEKASGPKTSMASPTKPRTVPKSPSANNIARNIGDSSKMPQTKMAEDGSLPQPTLSSPTKPKTLPKTQSVDKIPPKKPLRKERSCPVESSPVAASERRPSLKPPWRGGAFTPSRSQTGLSLAQSGMIRRSESSMSVNAGLRSRAGMIRPATSLPHIPKSSGSRPCLLVALRPTNLQQERERFFQSEFTYEPQFEYEEVEISAVLDKYREGSDLFLQQAVGIMEVVLRKYGSYENFEEVTGGSVLPKSQVWAAVRKYLQKEGCVGEVVVRLSDELLSQAVMVVENCRPTLTINLSGARQHWLEGMLRHEIGTHYLRGVNNSQQPWASSEHRKALGLKGVNPTEEGLASLHSVLLRRQPHLWRAALLYYTVHHAGSMSFSRLFHHIQRFVHSPDVRWEYCLRAKRGQTDTSRPGCFSKDQVYLDGILRILRHRKNIDFQLLTALGKVSFEDVDRLRPLAVLSRTRIPHFMTDTDKYQAQLDHILNTNELSDAELQQLLP